jgi:multidrug resistance efflux pump
LVRATGLIQAVRAFSIQVPRITAITGATSRLTLVKLVPTGTKVQKDDVLAEFDAVTQRDAALDAQAKYEDLAQQVKQTEAQNRSEREKRLQSLKQADADLQKAELELRKGPTLSEIERLQNEAKAESARAQVESLKKTNQLRETAAAAGLRRLQLQMERQLVALERTKRNMEQMVVHAPIAGMVSLENTIRSSTISSISQLMPAQEGDQLYGGYPLLKIFDPSEIEMLAQVGEPDGAVLTPGRKAVVRLDAYPDVEFPAHLVSASPVATTMLSTPVKSFTARFRIDKPDPRLMPDLSAVVLIQRGEIKP